MSPLYLFLSIVPQADSICNHFLVDHTLMAKQIGDAGDKFPVGGFAAVGVYLTAEVSFLHFQIAPSPSALNGMAYAPFHCRRLGIVPQRNGGI
jgi:hypothetical protein